MNGLAEFELAPGLWNICVRDKGAIVGVEIRGFYDGVAYWQCQQCLQVWDRGGKPHAQAKTVPHPVRRLFTVGDYHEQEAEKAKAAKS